jgi:hypothetical protein
MKTRVLDSYPFRIKSGKDLHLSRALELLSIEVRGEKFEIKAILWGFIATGLIKE